MVAELLEKKGMFEDALRVYDLAGVSSFLPTRGTDFGSGIYRVVQNSLII